MRSSVVLFLALAGCGSLGDESTSPDLAVTLPDFADTASHDLATPEQVLDAGMCAPPPRAGFTPPTNAADFCAGTSIAGTCVQTFFYRLVQCFHPAGCAIDYRTNNFRSTVTQASGATWFYSYGDATLAQDGVACAWWFRTNQPVPNQETWRLADGTPLTVTGTNDVTCPDGTHVSAGPAEPYHPLKGLCPELDAVLGNGAPYSGFCCSVDCCLPDPGTRDPNYGPYDGGM